MSHGHKHLQSSISLRDPKTLSQLRLEEKQTPTEAQAGSPSPDKASQCQFLFICWSTRAPRGHWRHRAPKPRELWIPIRGGVQRWGPGQIDLVPDIVASNQPMALELELEVPPIPSHSMTVSADGGKQLKKQGDILYGTREGSNDTKMWFQCCSWAIRGREEGIQHILSMQCRDRNTEMAVPAAGQRYPCCWVGWLLGWVSED